MQLLRILEMLDLKYCLACLVLGSVRETINPLAQIPLDLNFC